MVMVQRRFSWRALVGAAVAAVVLSTATTAVANHVFPDVSEDDWFHDGVANVAGAGCATGYPDGTFGPRDKANRGQFAAWMNRCAGRVTRERTGTVTISTSGPAAAQYTNSVSLVSGAAAGANTVGGFVELHGTVVARTTGGANCPCFVQGSIEDVTDPNPANWTAVGSASFAAIPNGATELNAESFATIPLHGVAAIGPEETRSYAIRVFYQDANVGSITFNTRLVASYVPFGPGGGNSLDL
jgi:hypothetical protein